MISGVLRKNEGQLVSEHKYLQLIGSLVYVSKRTLPDRLNRK